MSSKSRSVNSSSSAIARSKSSISTGWISTGLSARWEALARTRSTDLRPNPPTASESSLDTPCGLLSCQSVVELDRRWGGPSVTGVGYESCGLDEDCIEAALDDLSGKRGFEGVDCDLAATIAFKSMIRFDMSWLWMDQFSELYRQGYSPGLQFHISHLRIFIRSRSFPLHQIDLFILVYENHVPQLLDRFLEDCQLRSSRVIYRWGRSQILTESSG